jgi:hypothetical protein
MKKLFLISILVFSFTQLLLAEDVKMRVDEFPAKEIKAQKEDVARLMAEELNSTLPQVVDRYTTLLSVKNNKATLIYTFEINTGAKSDEAVQKEDHSRMKEAVTQGICQSSSKLLSAGINTTYIYISAKSKNNLFRFDIKQEDCIKIK